MKNLNVKMIYFPLLVTLFLFGKLNAQSVGINKEDFMKHYHRQQTLFWCWASSAEMVLSYEGIKLGQDAIVTNIKGFPQNATGNPSEMIRSTNRIFNDVNNIPTVISGQYIIGAPLVTVLYNQLKSKRPVILTYSAGQSMGHAVVLTGIDYKLRQDNSLEITKFYIFDPFAYKPQLDNFGRQKFDFFGNPLFDNDDTLIYKEYELWEGNGNLFLKTESNNYVGTVSGVILIDGVKL